MKDFEQTANDLYEANGDLSEADMLSLLTGGTVEGETAGKDPADTSAPGAGATEGNDDGGVEAGKEDKGEKTPEGKDGETDAEKDGPKVILAKDGVHTISYDKLVEARESAKAASATAARLEQEAATLRAEVEALRTAKAATPAAQTPAAEVDTPTGEEGAELFGDYSEESLKKGVTTILSKETAALRNEIASLRAQLAPVQAANVEDANTRHYNTIYGAHADADSIVESAEFAAWIDSQPRVVRDTYKQVFSTDGKGGTAQDVVEVFDAYRKAHPGAAAARNPAVPGKPGSDVQARAAAALAKAKTRTPTSLSDIPAGASVHTDEAEALAGMDDGALMSKMLSMRPDDIEKLMARTV